MNLQNNLAIWRDFVWQFGAISFGNLAACKGEIKPAIAFAESDGGGGKGGAYPHPSQSFHTGS